MGFSSGFRSCDGRVGVTLRMLVLVLLWGTCSWAASGDYVAAAPNLKVANNLTQGALTVLHPSGCCSPCGPNPPPDVVCPQVCVDCDDVVVQRGTAAMLDMHVGPFPLPYLHIRVEEKVYCVAESDLKLIKPWATLSVGPGACPFNAGLASFVSVREHHVAPLCLHACY
jgi:hypothetical protein